MHEAHPSVAADLERGLRSICDPEVEDGRADRFVEAQLRSMAATD